MILEIGRTDISSEFGTFKVNHVYFSYRVLRKVQLSLLFTGRFV